MRTPFAFGSVARNRLFSLSAAVYGCTAGETWRLTGKMQSPRCTVGADSISARFAAAQGLREGHAPPLHGIRARPAKWDCRGRPGERRAGCPHPAGPRGAANARGRDLRPKSRRCAAVGLRNAPAGAVNPAPTANGRSAAKREPRVITNLCRGRCLHRPEGPRGGANARGRELRPKSRRCAAVGLRNAPAGAVNPASTNKLYASGHPGGRRAGRLHPA